MNTLAVIQTLICTSLLSTLPSVIVCHHIQEKIIVYLYNIIPLCRKYIVNLSLPQLFMYFFFNFLLEQNCFTVLCQFLLYNIVNHIYIYLPSFWISFPLTSTQSIEQSFPILDSRFLLIIFFFFFYIVVYLSQPQSPNLSHSPFLYLVSIHLFSTFESLFLLCKFIRTFFLDSTYMH